MNCHVCKKMGKKEAMVGLNGRFSHVECFSESLSRTMKPLKDAMKKAGVVVTKEPPHAS